MLLYFVRHGQTALNGQDIIQGHLDPPLSPLGAEQAAKLGVHLAQEGFSEVWTSDLQRAEQTARGVVGGKGVVIRTDTRLRARDMGSLQGMVWHDGLVYPEDVEADTEVEKRLGSWLAETVQNHTPTPSPVSSPTDPTAPLPGWSEPQDAKVQLNQQDQQKVLVVTHEECLLALVRLLTTRRPLHVDGQGSVPKPGAVLGINDGINVHDHLANTALSVLRIEWEDADGELVPKGVLESWGLTDHLHDQ